MPQGFPGVTFGQVAAIVAAVTTASSNSALVALLLDVRIGLFTPLVVVLFSLTLAFWPKTSRQRLK